MSYLGQVYTEALAIQLSAFAGSQMTVGRMQVLITNTSNRHRNRVWRRASGLV